LQAQTAHFSGAVTTLVSGLGGGPVGVAVDASGNIFVADSGNNAVKEFTAASGYNTVTALGSGFNAPRGVAVDSNGNVFVADTGNNAVKEILSAGGYSTVNTLGSGFSGPRGVAVDSTGNVFVADSGNNAVREVVAAGGYATVNTLGGGGTFASPYGITLDVSANVFVVSEGDGTVNEMLSADGYTTTNLLINGLNGPTGIAVDSSENVFVSVPGDNQAYEFPASGGYATFVALASGFSSPQGMATDASGNVLVGDTGNGVIKKVFVQGVNFGTVAVASTAPTVSFTFTFDTAGSIGHPSVLTAGAPNLDFADAGSGTCTTNITSTIYSQGDICTVDVRFIPKGAGPRYGGVTLTNGSGVFVSNAYVYGVGTGPQVSYSPAVQTTLHGGVSPFSMAADLNGNVFVADTYNSQVGEILAGGGYVTLGSGFNYPFGIAVDGNGNVFVADSGNGVVKELMAAGGYTTVLTLSAGFGFPYGVAVDGSGNLFVADGGNTGVYEVMAAGGYTTVNTLGGSFGFGNPTGIAVDVSDNVFVGDENNSAVYEILAAGGYTTVNTLAAGFSTPGFLFPTGVAVDRNGNVFVADEGGAKLFEILAAGGYTTVNDVTGSLSRPAGVAVDTKGNVFIADEGAGAVVKWDFADPPALNFANTAVGSTSSDSPKTVTLQNSGSAPLIFPVPTSGLNPTIAAGFTLGGGSTCPRLTTSSSSATLAVGASCTCLVSFSPTVAGSNSGSLAPTDTALNGAAPSYTTQSISLNGLATGPPTITFTVPNHTYGDAPFTVSATSNSSGAITYSVASGPATISGHTVTLTGAGTVVLHAAQAASSPYTAGTTNATFTVAGASPTITFTIANKTYGVSPFAVSATSNSSGALTYSVVSGPATISGSTVTITGAGTVILQASQAASGNYAAATQNATFTVAAAAPTISFTVANKTYGVSPFAVSATSNSAGAFTYSLISGPATISGSTVTITGAGTVVLQASQAASGNYAAGTQNATFTVSGAAPTISFTVADQTYGVAPFTVGATSNSAGAFTYSVVSGPATISGSTVTITGAGTVVLQASQTASVNYAAATQSATFTIALGVPTISFTVANQTYRAAPFAIGATSNSAGAFTYSVVSGPATISGSTVTLTSGGTVVLQASQAASGNYSVSIQNATFNVSGFTTPAVNLGSVAVATTTPATTSLTFVFAATETMAAPAVLTQGAANLDFTDVGTGTCTTNGTSHTYNAGDTCTVDVTFTPKSAGPRHGGVTLTSTAGQLLASAYMNGVGTGPQVTFSPAVQSILGNNFGAPGGVAVDGNGNIFVADVGNGTVNEMLAASNYTTVNTVGSGFVGPQSVAVDGNGNLFVADTNGSTVKEILAVGGYVTVKTLGSGFSLPDALALDGNGNVFVADTNHSAVKEILAVGAYTSVQTLGSGFSYPAGVAVDGSGNVFVTDNGHNAVKEILAAGNYTTINTLFTGATQPFGLAVDANGDLFIADNAIGVYEILAQGGYTTINTLTDGSDGPTGVALDGGGNVFVANFDAATVVKLAFANAPSLSFATTATGHTSSDSPKTVTLTNSGNAALTFPVPTSGLNPSIGFGFAIGGASSCPQLTTSSSAATLDAGASCTYLVSFTPVAVGSASGLLAPTDNALNSTDPSYATQGIALSGTATGPPTITFSVPNHTYGDAPFTVSATSNSAGAFTYSYVSGPATILGSTVTITGTGTVVLQASQAASSNYTAATQNATFTVAAAAPAISFTVANQAYGVSPFAVSATSNSSGAFTYSVVSGPASIAGSTVTITGVGTVVLQASQAASGNYAAATHNATFTVAAAAPTISFTVANQTYGTAPLTLSANSNSAGAFTYSVVSGPATISGSAVTLTSGGTVVLQASQAASGNYTASTQNATFNVSGFTTPTVNLGSVAVATPTPATTSLTFVFAATGTIAAPAVLTQGGANLDFTDAGTGTCTTSGTSHTYNAGDTCTVDVAFTPKSAGPRYGGVTLTTTAGQLLASAYVSGVGTGPQVTYSPAVQSILGSNFGAPGGVAVDGSGNVFVADTSNNAVKEIVAAGGYTNVLTLASGFSQPNGVVVDGNGNLFVADAGNNAVKEILAVGGYTTVSTLGSGFNNPMGVAVDGNGNVFVGDTGNRAVKEVPAGGYTTTPLTLGSGFNLPAGVAVDGNGNVFVADAGHNSVFEILAGGGYTIVHTLAGGFNAPYGVAVDANGNVFVADTSNNAVKEILAASGYTAVNTVAAGSNPQGVAVDGNGNVLVANTNVNAILKLDFADPPALTFATTAVGNTSSDSPQTVTLNNSGNATLTFPVPSSGLNPSIAAGFTIDGSSTCPQLTTSSGAASLAAGASCTYVVNFTPATVGSISGSLATKDTARNATTPSYTTQSIALSGIATGAPTIAFSVPNHTYGDAQFTVAATSNSSGAFTYSVVSGPATISGTTVTLSGAGTVVLQASQAASGDYTATTQSATFTVAAVAPILSFTVPNQTYGVAPFTVSASSNSSGAFTYSVVSGPATVSGSTVTITGVGNVLLQASQAAFGNYSASTQNATFTVSGFTTLVVNFGSVAVATTTPATTSLTFTFGSSTTIAAPAVLTLGAANLDFTDAGTGTCTTNGNSHTYNGGDTCTVDVTFKPKFAGLRYGGVTLTNGSGALIASTYLSGAGTGPQLTFSPAVSTSLGSGVSGPGGVAIDGNGNVFVADTGNNAVKEIVAAGGYINVLTLGSGFNRPNEVVVDGNGNLFVADAGNNAVKEILAVGGYTTVSTLGSGFNNPSGVAVDGSGNVFVGDTGNRAVKEIPAGGYTTTPLTLGSGFNQPIGVAVDGTGNVFVADAGHNSVFEILANGGYTVVYTRGGGFNAPYGVALDANGNVFVADVMNNAVKEILAASGYTAVNAVAAGSNPQGVAVDGNGNVLVANTNANAILKLDFADPPALTFASTAVGDTSSDSPQTVTLNNSGNATLTFPVPTVGLNPSVAAGFTIDGSSTCPQLTTSSSAATLAAGASCTYLLNFVPATIGSMSGSLAPVDTALNSAAPSYTTQSIALSGIATGPPTITFNIANHTYGDAPFAVSATSNSPGAITYSVVSGPATILGTTVTLTGAGTVILQASQAASGDYTAATQNATFTVAAVAPTITFIVPNQTYGVVPFTVSASSNSAGTFTYSVVSGPATISGSTVTITGTGTVVLQASQAASGNYAAATQNATCTIAAAAATISFSVLNQSYGVAPFTVSASSNSAGAFTYSVVSGPATISGSTVTITGAGTVVLQASQAASGNYVASSQNTTLAIGGFTTQAVNMGPLPIASAPATTSLTFVFAASGSVAAPAVLAMGAPNLDFTDTGIGTCTTNGTSHTYNAGDTCTVGVIFAPQAAGARYGGVTLTSTSGTVLATAYVTGVGTGPQATFGPPTRNTLGSGLASPTSIAFDGIGDFFVADNGGVEEIAVGNRAAVNILNGSISGIAVDGNGNVFVSDTGNHAVKEILAASGYTTVTTLSTAFVGPAGLAVDGAGNVFVADSAGSAVYKIVSAAGSTTVTMLGTGFSSPKGVAVDANGNVLVADTGNNAVKEILAGGGNVQELGSGFSAPSSVAVDATGNVFVADTDNNAVKEIVAAGNYSTVQTLDGGAHPLGVAVNDRNRNIIIVYGGAVNVVKLVVNRPPSLSFAATSVGSTSSDSPRTVTITNSGNAPLTFPVPGSGLNPSIGAGFTIGGSSTCPQLTTSSNAAAILAIGASCTYLVSFTPVSSGSISSSLVSNNTSLNTATPASFAFSGSATSAPAIAFSVSDQTYGVVPFSLSTSSNSSGAFTYSVVSGPATIAGSIVTITGTGTVVLQASQAASGNYAAGTQNATFTVAAAAPTLSFTVANQTYGVAPFAVSATSNSAGAFTFSVVSGPATISGSTVTLTSGGTVVLQASQAASGNYAVSTQDATFTAAGFTTPAVNLGPVAVATATPATTSLTFVFAATGTIAAPAVLTQGAANLDFTDAGTGSCTVNGASHSYSVGDTCTVNVTFSPKFAGPRYGGVTLTNMSGALIANAYVSGKGTGPQVTFSPAVSRSLGSGFSNPSGTAVDGDGNVFVADSNNGVVYEILAASGYTTVNTVGGGFLNPTAVAVDGIGNVFVADFGTASVYEILAAGGYTTVNTLGSGFTLDNPFGVAVGRNGNVFVADAAGAVYEILATGGYTTVSTLANSFNFGRPFGVAVDGNGNVFVADSGNSAVYEILLGGGYTTVNTLGSGFTGPTALAVDTNGNVFVADNGNNAVKEILSVGGYTTVNTLKSNAGGPNGIAVDASGNVFVAESTSVIVEKLDFADPPALTFATTAVGNTSSDSPRTVTLNNYGNATLTFPVPSSGLNPSIAAGFTIGGSSTCPQLTTSSSPATLAVGASCTYLLNFTPAAIGSMSGSLFPTDTALNGAAPNYTTQNITLSGAATGLPTINFSVPNHTYGDAPFTVSATSNSAGAITYSVVSGPATISAATVTLTGSGTVVLQAAEAASGSYLGGTQNATFSVAAGAPTVTFTVPNHTFGDAPFAVSASSNSSGALTYSVISGPATISGATVTITGVGTVVMQASQAASGNYAAATQNANFAVAVGPPTITFAVPNHTFGDAPFAVSASSNSVGAFTYSVVSGPATISGATVTITGIGTVVLQASQVASGNYAVATQNATFTVAAGAPTITFTVPNHTFGDAPFAMSASSNSSGAFTYSVVSGPATISGTTVTITGIGTVVLQASQVASGNYAAATQNATFAVAAGVPTISFSVPNHTFGDAPFSVSSSSNSSGAFSYSVVSGPATISGTTVTIIGTGTVVLQTSQAASGNYAAATQNANFAVAVGPPTITFSVPNHTFGDSAFAVSASSNSSGAFTYSVVSGPATISGTTVTITGIGTVVLQSSQVASGNYAAAAQNATFAVAAGVPTISFSVPNHTFGDAPFAVSASSNSSGALTYSVISGPATISGPTVNVTGAGTVVLQASQAASGNYAAATQNTSFTVVTGAPTITFAVPNHTYGDPSFGVTATSNSPGALSYSVISGPATVSGSTIGITGAGTVVLQASQVASGSYSAATQNAIFTIAAGSPSITFIVPTHTFGDAPFTIIAVSNSAGPFTYSVISGPATISGNTVTLTNAGTVVMQAFESPNGNFSAAPVNTTMVAAAAIAVAPAAPADTEATVTSGAAATFPLNLTPQGAGIFTGEITFSASGLPTGATATFSPASIPAGSPATSVTLTIQTSTSQNSNQRKPSDRNPLPSFEWGFLLLPAAGLKGVRKRLKNLPFAMLMLSVLGVLSLVSCGNGSATGTATVSAAQTYNIVVTAKDSVSGAKTAINLTLTVQ
jgi:sugar lactone lactonase YvrE